MRAFFAILLALPSLAVAQGFPRTAALASTTAPGGGIVFSPTGGSFSGVTQFVGLSYPTTPADTIVFTIGTLCSNPAVTCPVGNSVISLASALYTGPASGCSSGSGGFGTCIKAPTTGSGTTINVQVETAVITQQNNMSTTSLPASWFPNHWRMITPNTLTAPSTGLVAVPTTGTCGAGGCAGNVLKNTLDTTKPAKVSYLSCSPSSDCSTGGGVGTLGTVTSAWAIPNATVPVTPPVDPLTGVAANATSLGFFSSSQSQSSYGDPQFLFTEVNAQNCGLPSVCTWMVEDFWILADGGPVAAWEADLQIGDNVGAWTAALQCRIHSHSGTLVGWGQGNQTLFPPIHIPNTSAANCPSTTQWLHVIYYATLNPGAQTYTIVSLTLQSAPGGPAGSTGYAVFPVGVTYNVDPKQVIGDSCTNQIQIDQWCGPSGCGTTQYAGAYIALNKVHCGTGTPPVAGPTTQIYN
jgi:hypothetical protein